MWGWQTLLRLCRKWWKRGRALCSFLAHIELNWLGQMLMRSGSWVQSLCEPALPCSHLQITLKSHPCRQCMLEGVLTTENLDGLEHSHPEFLLKSSTQRPPLPRIDHFSPTLQPPLWFEPPLSLAKTLGILPTLLPATLFGVQIILKEASEWSCENKSHNMPSSAHKPLLAFHPTQELKSLQWPVRP